MDRESTSRLEEWLGAVEQVSIGHFEESVSLSDLPDHVRSESEFWCDEILSPAANPHDAPDTRHRICRASGGTPDLLGHDLRAGDLAFTVIEGRNFLLVRVDRSALDLLALPEQDRGAAISRVAATLFKSPLDFGACTDLGEGSMFCTDSGIDPRLLTSWSSRADGVIRNGELWFVCYKRCPQRVGFANACQWFSDTGAIRPRPRRGARRSRRKP